MDMANSDTDRVQLTPAQPREVVAAVAGLLADVPDDPDPWWQAGLDDALEV